MPAKAQREKLHKLRITQNKANVDLPVLVGIADYEGAIEQAVKTAKDMLREAREHLIALPGTDHAAGLVQISHYLDALLDGCVGQ